MGQPRPSSPAGTEVCASAGAPDPRLDAWLARFRVPQAPFPWSCR